jgi:hypothetical protein
MSAKPKRTAKNGPQPVARTVQSTAALLTGSEQLVADLREMIVAARRGVARAIDSGLVALYWQIGRRLRQDIFT